MNQHHYTSLNLSKKLKEAGVPQESEFYYQGIAQEIESGKGYTLSYGKQLTSPLIVNVSAFSVAELGEVLPDRIENTDRHTLYWLSFTHEETWTYSYADIETGKLMVLKPRSEVRADSEAEARGLMLLYLLDHKLILPEQLRRGE